MPAEIITTIPPVPVKKISVGAGLDKAVRQFGIETVEQPIVPGLVNAYNLPPGTAIQIFAGAELLLDGYVNAYRPEYGPKGHKVMIEGRSKGQDWVDSSAIHAEGSWQNKTPLQIANELNDSGIGISAKVPLDTEEDWNLYQGEPGFATVERMLRHQGSSQMGLANGDIEITNASVAKRMAGPLVEGRNILEAYGQLTDMRRFQEVIVKGQRRTGTGAGALRVSERYKDRGVGRKRHKMLIHEGNTTTSKAQKRARNEAERAQGASVRAKIVVAGFRDDVSGELWQPNRLVFVHSPLLKIEGDLLIEGLMWSQDNDATWGTRTELYLVHPLAYGGKAGSVTRTDPAWSAF